MTYKFSTDWFEGNAGYYWGQLGDYLKNTFGENCDCLDVGTFEGRSAVYMIENFLGRTGALHIIDPLRESYHPILLKNLEYTGAIDRVHIHAGDSVIELPKLLEIRPESFQLIYLDAGKTASDNCLNALISERLLCKGGLLVIDDYLWLGNNHDPRYCPRLGIDFYSTLTILTRISGTPRTQAVFIKHSSNETLLDANL